MTRVRLNGAVQAVAAATLAELLATLGIDPDARGVAAARNGAVVLPEAWAGTALAEGDEIDVVRAYYGG